MPGRMTEYGSGKIDGALGKVCESMRGLDIAPHRSVRPRQQIWNSDHRDLFGVILGRILVSLRLSSRF